VIAVLEVIASGALGGGTTQLLDLVGALDPARFRVAVACGTDGALASDLAARGVETFPVDFMRARVGLAAWRALGRGIAAARPAIVHAHGSRAALAAAAALRLYAPRGPRPALVYSEHGLSFEAARGPLVALPAMLVERAVGACGAHAIALSRRSARLLRRLGTFASVAVIPYMVRIPAEDADRRALRRELEVEEEAPLVGTIMRFVSQKAPERFVALAARVLERRPDARFVAIGDGPLRGVVEAEIARRGLGRAVRLAGARPGAAWLLGALDVFALLSRWEGMPISILEAQARALPVVATGCSCVPEMLRGGAGRAVRQGDVAAAARAVVGYLADPEAARRAGERGRERVREENDPARVAALVGAVYARLTSSPFDRRHPTRKMTS
jgi:glycosyltransferase involved in cell wall biosynthesis